MKMPSPGQRRWMYRVANAALAVAIVYQVVDGEEAALWLLLVNALLGLADANVPQEPVARHVAPPQG